MYCIFLNRLLIIGLQLILVFPFFANGQVTEKCYLIDKTGNECFDIDFAKEKIDVVKVMNDTYVISYSYKYEDNWCKRRFYDELRTSYYDTLFYMTRIYTKCCDSGNYRESDNTKTICVEKIDSLYSITILNYDDEIVQKGKSKHIFPFMWTDTLFFFSENKLYKKVIHSKEQNKVSYWYKNGDKIELAKGSLDRHPNFVNTNKTFEQNLQYFFTKSTSYPKNALENDIDGKVYIRFIITKEGEIECVEDLRRVPILSDYCIELIKSLPKLSPALKNGIEVNVSYVHSIPFNID